MSWTTSKENKAFFELNFADFESTLLLSFNNWIAFPSFFMSLSIFPIWVVAIKKLIILLFKIFAVAKCSSFKTRCWTKTALKAVLHFWWSQNQFAVFFWWDLNFPISSLSMKLPHRLLAKTSNTLDHSVSCHKYRREAQRIVWAYRSQTRVKLHYLA